MGRWRRGFGLKGGREWDLLMFLSGQDRHTRGTLSRSHPAATEGRREARSKMFRDHKRWEDGMRLRLENQNAPLPVLPPFAESRWLGSTASNKMCGNVQDNAWKHGHGPKRTGGVAFWLASPQNSVSGRSLQEQEKRGGNQAGMRPAHWNLEILLVQTSGLFDYTRATQLISWAVYFVGEREGR